MHDCLAACNGYTDAARRCATGAVSRKPLHAAQCLLSLIWDSNCCRAQPAKRRSQAWPHQRRCRRCPRTHLRPPMQNSASRMVGDKSCDAEVIVEAGLITACAAKLDGTAYMFLHVMRRAALQ